MADETALLYEDPKLTRELRDAIRRFREAARYEMELCQDPFLIKNMDHFAASKALDMLMDAEDPAEIIKYLDTTIQHFKTYRSQQLSSNPIRIFKRERKAG